MSEDTRLKELIINTLSPEQMPEVLSETEIYLVEDDAEYATVEELATKQDVINDLTIIRNNASTGAGLAPQVAVNTQRIEDLTTAKFPNVVIVGTPHIEGGQVSNYSDTSYLQFPFVDISRGQPFDIYFSFTTSNDITTQQNILDSYFGIALAIQNGKGIMALSSNGSSWDIGTATGTNTLLPNTTYYVKYSWTGTAYSAALSTNDETYVPDMNLTSSLSPYKTTIFIGGSPNLFGPSTAHPFKGTINFNKSKVVVGQNVVWEGMADVGLASRANVSLNNLDEVGEKRFTDLQDAIDGKQPVGDYATNTALTTHTDNTTIHVTASDKTAWSQKQNAISDLDTIRSGASAGATAVQPNSLATVATSGSYNDLSNKPTIPSTDDCVKTSGNQTVAGVKTFTGGPVFKGTTLTNILKVQRDHATNAPSIQFANNTDVCGYIGVTNTGRPTIWYKDTNDYNCIVRGGKGVDVGSSNVPVYIDANGIAQTCNAIPSSTDFVKTSGNQTIAGVKTFSSIPVITSTALNINNSSDVSIQRAGTTFLRRASSGATILSAGGQTIYLRPNGDSSSSIQFSFATDGTLTATKFNGPLTGNVTGNCSGSSGSCTGNAATATKATQDGSGNNIVNTYAKKADIPSIYLKTSYTNGKSGYNIWSNGYCEQWGYTNDKTTTINLVKTYKDTNYNILLGQTRNSDTYLGNSATINDTSVTANSFKITTYGTAYYAWWKTSGMLASGQY